MSALKLEILNAAGTRIGGLIDVFGAEFTARLSRVGEWNCEVPIGDPKIKEATSKRRVRLWAWSTAHAPKIVGEGIIDERQTRVGKDGTTLVLGGDDLLGELIYRLVWTALQTVETYHEPIVAALDDLNVWHVWNGDEASDVITFAASDSYFWGGLPDTTFNRVNFAMGLANLVVTPINLGVSDERGNRLYRAPETVEDTTLTGFPEYSWGADGYMDFPRPASWDKRDLNDEHSALDVPDGEYYWLRFDPEAKLGSDNPVTPGVGISFDTISVQSFIPQANDIQALMAFAPTGWVLIGYTGTINGTLARYDGDSLMSILVSLAEQRGEQFRLEGSEGNGRVLRWLRTDQTSSGIRAIQLPGYSVYSENNTNACYITDLAILEDAHDLVTRVYPFGSGNGLARGTLGQSTLSVPAGFTIDRANNYIAYTAGETAYGVIAHKVTFPEIGNVDGTSVRDRDVSNQILLAGLAWLKQRIAPYKGYRLTVTGLKKVLRVGDTIRVTYYEHREGYRSVELDTDLVVLSTKQRYTPEGGETVEIEVALPSQPRFPVTDGDMQAKLWDSVQKLRDKPMGISGGLVR